jgi:hypothetical protein
VFPRLGSRPASDAKSMSQLATSFFFQRSSRRTRGSRADRSRGKAIPDVTLLINNAGATGGYGDTTANEGVGAGADLRLRLPSALDVGLGSIIACRYFVVPMAILVPVRNACRVSRERLVPLLRAPLLGGPCRGTGRSRRTPHRPGWPTRRRVRRSHR